MCTFVILLKRKLEVIFEFEFIENYECFAIYSFWYSLKIWQWHSSFAPDALQIAMAHIQLFKIGTVQERFHLQCPQWIASETQFVQAFSATEHSWLENRDNIVGEIQFLKRRKIQESNGNTG